MGGRLWLFRKPVFDDADLQRRAEVGMSVLRAIGVAVIAVMTLATLDPANSFAVTLALYGPMLLLLVAAIAALHRGHVSLVGWGAALALWAIVTVVLVFFGGLAGHNAMSFTVAMTVAGTVAGGRAAISIGALSVGSAVVAYVLESRGLLPPPLAPVSLHNSLIAVAVSMALSGWLLALSLRSLQRALDAERLAAAQRDAAHAKAVSSQRLESVGRLAAGVAHDLNNMLAVVQLTTEELRRLAAATPALKGPVEDLSQAADQAALLSRRLVGMARTKGSPPEPLEVGEVAEHFAPLLRRLLPQKSSLSVERKSQLPITASRSALEHVLLNLVVNARDAMPGGGPIEVVVDGRELAVRDHGVGITPEVKAQLFTPFFTTRQSGTGLGLANVAELAESMRAEVKVDSEPGKGSTFKLVFSPATP